MQGIKTIHHQEGSLDPTGPTSYQVGAWGDDAEVKRSNYQELANLVEDTEVEAEAGGLRETELFLFTDNTTTEMAFYNGSSSSKILHGLLLCIHKLSMNFGIILHVVHVYEKCMIAQ